jgi:hypothetical protein
LNGAKVYGSVRSSQSSVTLKLGSHVTGDVTAGTTIANAGTIDGTATPNAPATPLAPDPVAACSPFGDASGISGSFTYDATRGDLTVKGGRTATLAAGTYCFHNLTVAGGSTLRAAGAVVIVLTGKLDAGGGSTLTTASATPGDLQIRSSYSGTDGVTLAATRAVATIYAPRTDVSLAGGSVLFGSLLGKTLAISGDSAVHFDVH